MLALWLLPFSLFGQTEPSALFEMQSTDKGFLLPRMTEAQRDAIQLPATGLMIFNTTTFCVDINFGIPAAPSWQEMSCRKGIISSLTCGGAVMAGTLSAGTIANGVSVQIPYSGGNGGPQSGQMVTSTGVLGLTATLAAGNFAMGAGSLIYAISGTPATPGTANFALSIGGQNCMLSLTVGGATPTCWAKVSATYALFFLCHNLASANTSADPFTPSWEINGGYWQWGCKGPDPSVWLNTNTENFAHGPTGIGPSQVNEGDISGWSSTFAPNGAWSDAVKTANDPCPAGYRVPNLVQWNAVYNNNTQSVVGSWIAGATNYSAGRFFGPDLMLPAAGYRGLSTGTLFSRGNLGNYWSSAEQGTDTAWDLYFGSGFAYTLNSNRRYGLSIRCAAENSVPIGSIGSLDCNNAIQSGTLTSGVAASGVSVQIPYSGGNGGPHGGQVVTSTGVSGLTATLAAGSFAMGASSLIYTISGTPAASGTANFALSIGGQNCILTLTVGGATPTCWAKVSATDTLFFLCHNLASANISADPFTPSWEINGGYWQWGRKGPDPAVWLNTNTANFAHGPTGSGTSQTNEGAISGWSQIDAPNGAWSDAVKTANDPCPAGYRVPTKAQWDGVRANNSQSIVGTWSVNAANYTTGRFFGPGLMLPAAGYRHYTDGALFNRGNNGLYWSSTENGTDLALYLYFNSGFASTGHNYRRYGVSVRCAAE
jgi:uncharacterized protein (TIGR02145 family)